MSKTAQADAHQAVLHQLHAVGPATYLDLEYRLNRPGLDRVVKYLRQNDFIQGQPKKAGRLRVYEITDTGRKAIGLLDNLPEPTSMHRRPDYVPPAPGYTRPGALDAFMIPSGDRFHQRATA